MPYLGRRNPRKWRRQVGNTLKHSDLKAWFHLLTCCPNWVTSKKVDCCSQIVIKSSGAYLDFWVFDTPSEYPMDCSTSSTNIGSGVAHEPSNGPLPIKRKPEEEVQFVSSKPVKKCRGSKGSSAQAYRGVNPTDTSRVGPPPGDTGPVNTPSHVVSSLLTSQPLHELSNFNRGASLPSMENYVFPPPHDGITRQTARSSPMLSPKQLPPAVPSGQADNQLSTTIPLNTNDAKPPAWCTASWAASGVPAQPTSMNIHMAPNQPMMSLYVQPSAPEPTATSQEEKQQPRTSEKLTNPVHCPEPVPQPRKELGAEHTQNSYHYPLEESTGLVQSKRPSGTQKAWQPAQPTSQTPPGPMPHTQPPAPQHVGNNNGYGVAAVHPFPPKPPCAACEQMRQQALHNKTNIYPVVGTSSHASHGWNGPEVAHVNPPIHMQPAPFPAAGYGMSPNMAQNHLHRPQHLYHGQVPMGYGFTHVSAQGPYPTPVQKVFPVPDMSASDSGAGVPSHKFNANPQLNASPALSAMPQTERSQHTQAQYGSSQPPVTQPSLTAAPSPTPATAPTPRPTTPSPSEKHSANLIVDIAETCEVLFPWDEVAERHNVPRQKVVDTFAAIIQLPLIRCTTDKKRHGRLATNRLKDYTRGKNAMCLASTASPDTPPASAKLNSNENQDGRPVLPGVVELANSMAPVTFPPTLTQKYPGTW